MNKIRRLMIIGDNLFVHQDGVQETREDTLFLIESIEIKPADVVLEIGVGMGTGAILIGKKVKKFYGVDINEKAVKNTIMNGYLNGLELSNNIKVGDCFTPFQKKKFDVIFSNLPQLPTPPEKERADWIGWANNGGEDGRKIIDKVIKEIDNYLNPFGKLFLLHFEICNIAKTIDFLENRGLKVEIVSTKEVPFGKLSFERLDYISKVVGKTIIKKDQWYYHDVSIIKATAGGGKHEY